MIKKKKMNKIDLIDRDSGLKYNKASIEQFCYSLLDELEINNWEFSIMFCNDDYIAELNHYYRQKDGPTDVLTFCDADTTEQWSANGDNENYYAGDMLISIETLAKNAEYFKVDKIEELKRLIIHGVLHLKGMDHNTNDPDEEMLKLQERILNNFGEYKF